MILTVIRRGIGRGEPYDERHDGGYDCKLLHDLSSLIVMTQPFRIGCGDRVRRAWDYRTPCARHLPDGSRGPL